MRPQDQGLFFTCILAIACAGRDGGSFHRITVIFGRSCPGSALTDPVGIKSPTAKVNSTNKVRFTIPPFF